MWATSWGVSTRLIGAMVMSHSDDKGKYVCVSGCGCACACVYVCMYICMYMSRRMWGCTNVCMCV